MAYTVPSTFATGTTLTATDLNILGDDIVYLKGLIQTGVASITSSVVDINTAETVIVSYTIPANSCSIGTIFTIFAGGTATSTSATTVNFRLRIGPTTLTGSITANVNPTASTTSTASIWEYIGRMTIRSIGGSGVTRGTARVAGNGTAGSAFGTTWHNIDNQAGTIDTTVDNLLELTCQTGNANNKITATEGFISIVRT